MTESSPYRVLTLADVLTPDEVVAQPFAADTVLNGWGMPEPLGECFARMSDDERRAFVRNAIDFALHSGWSLASTLAALLEQAYAPPPRLP